MIGEEVCVGLINTFLRRKIQQIGMLYGIGRPMSGLACRVLVLSIALQVSVYSSTIRVVT